VHISFLNIIVKLLMIESIAIWDKFLMLGYFIFLWKYLARVFVGCVTGFAHLCKLLAVVLPPFEIIRPRI